MKSLLLTPLFALLIASTALGERLYLDDVSFIRQRTKSLFLTYATGTGPSFQINIASRATGQKSLLLKLGDKFLDDRYELQKYEAKAAVSATGAKVDASELTIYDSLQDKTFVLTKGVKINHLDFFAELEIESAAGLTSKIFPRKGETFRLPGYEEQFRLVWVGRLRAKVEDLNGNSEILDAIDPPPPNPGTPEDPDAKAAEEEPKSETSEGDEGSPPPP